MRNRFMAPLVRNFCCVFKLLYLLNCIEKVVLFFKNLSS